MRIYYNSTYIDVDPSDDSFRLRQIMGDDSVTLNFTLTEYIDFPIGAYINFTNQYTLLRPGTFRKNSTRNYEYSLVFEGYISNLKKYKIRDSVEKRLKFDFTGTPKEHLDLIINILNERESGWLASSWITAPAKHIAYNHTSLLDALNQIAETFDTEYHLIGKIFILDKYKINSGDPLVLSYGKGQGFKPGVGRANFDNSNAIEVLHVQGGTRNIDRGTYGNKELLLPNDQTYIYLGREYIVSSDGRSIQRNDKVLTTFYEDSIDLSNIYPSRVGTISSVTEVDPTNHFWDFVDSSISLSLDYSQNILEGEKMTVIFQTGNLAGFEFDVNYVHSSRKFEIVPQEYDGVFMPDSTFKPSVGDKYIVFGISMPSDYIRNDLTKAGASWDMFKEACKYLYENEEARFTFSGEMDGIWSKTNWNSIWPKVVLGGMVEFSDTQFMTTPQQIRIVSIKDYINNPYAPEIELSNITTALPVSSELKKIKTNEVAVDEAKIDAVRFTKRRYRDVQETIKVMYDPDGDYFTDLIKPLVVETAQVVVGTHSQQFDLFDIRFRPNYGGNSNDFRWTAGSLEHVIYDRDWIIDSDQVTLTNDVSYYVYARCAIANNTASIVVSSTKILLDDEAGYYHFWIGVISRALDNFRSWQPMHGFTEITGQFITTGVIKSTDGLTYFDLNNGEIGGRIVFASGARTLDELGTQSDETKNYIDNTLPGILSDIQNQLDGVIEQWFETYDPTTSNLPASGWITTQDKEDHLGDLFYNTDTGDVWRWVKDGTNYFWSQLSDSQAAQALQLATDALALADDKRRIFVAQPTTPYEVGDLWVQGTSGDIMRCSTARATGSYLSTDWVKASKYTDDSTVNALSASLGDLAYEDLIETAKLGTTIIDGGYIKTSLLNVNTIISTGNLETVTGSTDKANSAIATAAADATTKMNTALAAASNAQSTADSAELSATTANNLLTDIASDNKLTPDEKQATKKEWDIIVSEKVKIDASADSFGVSKAIYGQKYTDLSNYITPLLVSLASTSTIVGTTFRSTFKAYYDARQDLLNAIAAKSKALADSAQNSVDTLISNLGSLAYDDAVTLAKLDDTIIQGGYIKTALVDTDTLFAKHVLTSSSGKRVHIDGSNNKLSMYDDSNNELLKIDDNVGSDSYGHEVGGLVVNNYNGSRKSYVSGNGVFSNTGAFSFLSAATGITTNASVVGLLFDRNGSSSGISAAVVGLDATSSGVSKSFGGYFNSLFTGALHLPGRRVSSPTTLNETDCHVSTYNLGTITIDLPSNPKENRMIWITRASSASVIIDGNGKSIRTLGTVSSTVTISGNDHAAIFIYDGQYWTKNQMIA